MKRCLNLILTSLGLLLLCGCETWHDFAAVSSVRACSLQGWTLCLDTSADPGFPMVRGGRAKAVLRLEHPALNTGDLVCIFEMGEYVDSGYGKFAHDAVLRFSGWQAWGTDATGLKLAYCDKDSLALESSYRKPWRASLVLGCLDFYSEKDCERYFSSLSDEERAGMVLNDGEALFVRVNQAKIRQHHVFVEICCLTIRNAKPPEALLRRFKRGEAELSTWRRTQH